MIALKMTDRFTPYVIFGPSLLELDEVLQLACHMGISQVEAGGYIALVVALGIGQGDDEGQIDFLTTKAIEQACYWGGERGQLLNAFLACDVLSGERDSDTNPIRISTALWKTIAGPAIKKRIEARNRKRRERAKKLGLQDEEQN